MENFGEKLKKLMFDCNVTQEDLAKELKLDQSYISKLKLNKRTPSLKTLKQLSDFFKVPINFFLQNSNNTITGNNNIVGNQKNINKENKIKNFRLKLIVLSNMCDENTTVRVITTCKKNINIGSLNYKNSKFVYMKANLLIEDFEEMSATEFQKRFKQKISVDKVIVALTFGHETKEYKGFSEIGE